MPTAEERYAAATAWVRRAVVAVEDRAVILGVGSDGKPEWSTGREQAEPFRAELARLEPSWLFATTDERREHLAHLAESLAITALNRLASKRNAGLIDIQTPASTKAEMDTTNSIIHGLGGDIDRSRVDGGFKESWGKFADEWNHFYKEHLGWLDRLWYSAYEKTVEYRKRALAWRERFVALGGLPSSPPDQPPATASDRVDRLVTAALWGGGIYVAYRVASRYFKRGRPRPLGDELNDELARVANRGSRQR
jgi:hypothetical protein